jgi:hypothetical protein
LKHSYEKMERVSELSVAPEGIIYTIEIIVSDDKQRIKREMCCLWTTIKGERIVCRLLV